MMLVSCFNAWLRGYRFQQLGNRLEKNSKDVTFPTFLDLAPYCAKEGGKEGKEGKEGKADAKSEPIWYRLFGGTGRTPAASDQIAPCLILLVVVFGWPGWQWLCTAAAWAAGTT